MSQKQFIQESKEAEMQRGLEKGYMNKDKLEEYDKQLEMIDKQITEAVTKQYMDKDENKGTDSTDNKVMTEEEYEKRKMKDMMSMASGMEQTEIVSSVKEKVDGEARVLKSEIKLDGNKVLEIKKERVIELEARSEDLLEQVGNKIADINEDKSKIFVESDRDEKNGHILHTQNTTKSEENSDLEEILYYDTDDK